MKKLKVLIADDSVVYRSQIRAALQDLTQVEIVGAASNGRIAIERVLHYQPDLLILDLEMPEMDGLETLKELKSRKIASKVIVFSSLSLRGAEITMQALKLGAIDFITKPNFENNTTSVNPAERIKELLFPRLSALFPDFFSESSKSELDYDRAVSSRTPNGLEALQPKIVVIGSSTGGPTVLDYIFSRLPSSINCPIVIAQHMPPLFTTTFAEQLSKISGLSVHEARDGEELLANHVYLAPGNYHLRMDGNSQKTILKLDQGPQIHSVRPSVDPLFFTAASLFQKDCLAIILTGMGYDGRDGAISVKKSGGSVVIQDKESCIVFGMPGAVFQAGAFDEILSPDEIILLLNQKLGPEKTRPYQAIPKEREN